MPNPPGLSRRERQIMDAIFALGEATVNQVVESIPSPPTAMAVRRMMHILEEKGHLRHEKDGPRHVYYPVTPRNVAQKSAVRHMVGTFFNGSRAAAIAALLDDSDRPLSDDERAELSSVIKRLRSDGN
jgi:BlaI family transcriptional regulator, penicillinase repressor